MSFLLPLLVALFAVLCLKSRRASWLDAVLSVSAVCGLFVYLSNELLSLFHFLSFWPIVLSWSTLGVFIAWANSRSQFSFPELNNSPPAGEPDDFGPYYWFAASICLVLGALCILAPPNTTDAMAYHLPRVVYWSQNRTVGFYPTAEFQQLFMPPFAEYVMVQLYVLGQGDRLVNLVQLGAFAGTVWTTLGIAKKLGATCTQQAFSVVLASTLPVAILEASGAKNDLVVTFWLVLMTYSLLSFRESELFCWALIGGIAFGLAVLTKGTALIIAPFLLLAVAPIRNLQASSARKAAGAFLAIFLALNVAHWTRSYQLSGSPLGFPSADGISEKFRYRNEDFSPTGLISNTIRNAALHLVTPSEGANRQLEIAIRSLINWIGANPDDTRSTWTGTTFAINNFNRHEAAAPNPVHFLLIAITCGLLVLIPSPQIPPLAARLGMGVFVSFIAFSIGLQWQPWHTRLHIPIFMAAFPVVAVVLGSRLSGRAIKVISSFLMIMAGPYLLENVSRPLWMPGNVFDRTRTNLYFSERPTNEVAYNQIAKAIAQSECRTIGIDVTHSRYEYPLLALLTAVPSPLRLQQVGTPDSTTRYRKTYNAVPCAIVCLGCLGKEVHLAQYSQYTTRVHAYGNNVLLSNNYFVTSEAGCEANFTAGWYPREVFSPEDWLYWTSNKGTVQIQAIKPMHLQLTGALGSIVRPNRVFLTLNGTPIGELSINEPLRIALDVPAGLSTLGFRSREPGATPAGDSRVLAVAVRRLNLSSVVTKASCEINF